MADYTSFHPHCIAHFKDVEIKTVWGGGIHSEKLDHQGENVL